MRRPEPKARSSPARHVSEQIGEFDRTMIDPPADDEIGQPLLTMPGVEPVTASVLAAEMADDQPYGCGREFAASVGLVPRQHSDAAAPTCRRASKQGNENIRCSPAQCARAATQRRRFVRHDAARPAIRFGTLRCARPLCIPPL